MKSRDFAWRTGVYRKLDARARVRKVVRKGEWRGPRGARTRAAAYPGARPPRGAAAAGGAELVATLARLRTAGAGAGATRAGVPLRYLSLADNQICGVDKYTAVETYYFMPGSMQ